MTHAIKRISRPAALVLALALPLSGGAREARADTAAAQVLFDEAKKLMSEGKHAEACPKLEESQRLDPGVGTQYNLATCYEQIGKTASAWSLFLEVAAASKAAGQAEREKVARQRAAAIEPKLMRLAITVAEGAPEELQVLRDGTPIGRAQWGTPVPVDPGKHTVTAKSAGRADFAAAVELTADGATETVAIPLPDTWPAAGPVAGGADPPEEPTPAATEGRRNSTELMVGGIVLIGLGVLAGGTGLVVLTCTAPERADDPECKKIENPRLAGAVMTIGGVVAVGVGIPLTIIGARREPAAPAQQTAAPTLFVGPTGVALRWRM